MDFIDTHLHPVHLAEKGLDVDELLASARNESVEQFIFIGTDVHDSAKNIELAVKHADTWASVAQHPHEASWFGGKERATLAQLADKPRVVAIGECGLDYYYEHSDREAQKDALHFQLELGIQHNLPFSFHVRGSKDDPQDAFDDFFAIIDTYKGVAGVVHSFSANVSIMEQIVARGLYMGFNGILTFSSDPQQLAVAVTAPLANIVLETDAPFLTPAPFRGKVNEPKFVRLIAEFLASVREESLQEIALQTTHNAEKVFQLDGRTDT